MSEKTTRRRFLTATSVGAATVALSGIAQGSQSQNGAWSQAGKITSRVEPPKFPNQDFVITEYGAVGDGETDCTDAFKAAITECSEAGGGRVVVPSGTFLTGAIHLEDDVNLHVTDDATIKFSRDPDKYLPVVHTRYEGEELMNYSPFIYAYEKENIAITGSGTIDGRADEDHWWNWSGGDPPTEYDYKPVLNEMAAEGVPVEERVFGEGTYLRPKLVQPYKCDNLLIEGVTVTNSPMWHIHPVLCTNVTISGVSVDTPRGSNTDGCNPESCKDVHIEDCYFNTNDDCLSLKSGKNEDGRRVDVPCENVVIEKCEMRNRAGVVVGSETSGGVGNVFARNCYMKNPGRPLRIKSNPERGGYVRNVHVKNIGVDEASGSAIEIALDYANIETGPYPTEVRNINVKNLKVNGAERALYLVGTDDNPIQDLRLKNCVFENMRNGNTVENVDLTLKNVDFGDEIDLSIEPSDVSPLKVINGIQEMEVTVPNDGIEDSKSATLLVERTETSEVIAEETIDSVPAYGSAEVTFEWNTRDLSTGTHSLRFTVETTNDADEAVVEAEVLSELPDEYSTYRNTEGYFGQTSDDALVVNANGVDTWDPVDEYGTIFKEDSVGSEATITTKIESVEDTGSLSKAGLMVRNDVTAAGESTGYVTLLATPDRFQMLGDTSGNGYLATWAEDDGLDDYPVWLKLEKNGSVFTGYSSSDGETWVECGTMEIASVDEVQDAGVYVSAASSDDLHLAEFTEFDPEA